MNIQYINLFRQIARAAAVLAEKVLENDENNKDSTGAQTAKIMRNDYQNLCDKLAVDNSDVTLSKSEYAKLLVGAMIIINNIQNRIASEQRAVENYNMDVLPKLQRIINEASNDTEAQTLANTLFQISEESNS